MLFLEPDVDYFRIRLHQLALPEALLNGECVVPVDSRGADIPANGIQKETASSVFQDPLPLSLEEQAEVLHRALLASLHQRFPYEKHDTLENAYILAVTHLSSLMIAEVPLTCEELAAMKLRDSFLPPELQSRTFPSHLNELFTPQSSAGVVPTPNCGITTGGDERPQCTEKSETPATATHPYFYDSYFILLPELNTEEQRLYRKNHSDATRTRSRETDISGISSSTKNGSGATLWDSHVKGSRAKDSENNVKMGEGMVGLHVVDGNMIHFVSSSSEKRTNTALRSLQFSVFKIPLNRFTPDEQEYYTHKREETRFLGIDGLQKLSRKEKSGTDESSSVYMNDTLKSMLASEMPERYRDEEQESGKQFFSKCNTMLRSFVSSRQPRTSQSSSTRVNDDSKENQKQCFSATSTTTSNAQEQGSTNHPRNSACGVSTGSSHGVRRLVYSFAPCDCYHLVVDDNNPLYYAKSSRAAYNARTVTITLMSDMSLTSVASPTISLPRHAGDTCVPESKHLDGLVSSNLPSRAGSPEPSSSATSVRSRHEQQLQNQPQGRKDASIRREAVRSSSASLSRRGQGASRGQSTFSLLSSKTDGFLRLTTSLCCNNVSGNPKHRKETLLEKGIHLPDYSPDDLGSFRNPGCSPENASAVANLFRLLSTSSVAQHQLRHGVIRPVVSVAVLDDSGASASFLSRESAPLACRGLLDHTWYSIKVQPLPKLQDDIQWMPIVFGSSECVSDVGYRTAMHMGFFPSGASNDKYDSKKIGKSGYGVVPTVEDAKNSLAGAFEKKSSLAPLDPNIIQLRSEHSEKPQMNALENPLKETSANTSTRQGGVAMTFGNDDQPAGVSSRRGGVAMTFGNDDQPAGVSSRRGGVAMTFGNDDQPAGVSSRRGGVAMTFGNDDQPAGVSSRKGGVAMTFGNDDQPAGVSSRRGGVAMTFGNDDQPAGVSSRRGGVAMTFGNDDQPAGVSSRRGGVAMTFGNDDQPAGVSSRRGGVAMTFGNDEQPAGVSSRRGGVAMTFGNDDQPAGVSSRRGVAMTFGNDDQPAGVSSRKGGVAMTFGNDEQPAGVSSRRGGVAMTFGNDDQPAGVSSRRGGVAMTFGNDEQPAGVSSRRGRVAMTFGNDEQPAGVSSRRGGVAMTFGNDEQPAGVSSRRGGVAMTFGNDDQPAGVSSRREGLAMTFGNDEQPASVSSRRGGVAMTFGNDEQPVGVAARRPTMMFGVRDVETINKEEPGARQMNLDGGCFNDPNWFRSTSCGSPKAQRPTVFDRFGGTVGESGIPPDNGVRGGSPNCSTSTRAFGVSNRVRSPGPVMEDKRETQMGGWRPPSPGPMFGERDRISGFRSDGRQPGVPRDDLPPPGMARMTAMNTFGSIKSQPTPRPVAPRTSANGQQQSPWVEKPMFYPPYNDRWQSNDCSRDQSRGGSFWRPSSYGVARFSHELPVVSHGLPDPLASPISSMSRSGLAMQDERMKPFWQNTGFGQRNSVSTCNNNWNFTEVPTHPANHAFQRKGGIYNQDYPRSTYINEYNDYPANGSRVRPRGTQAMDDMWSRPWIPQSSQNASDLRRPVPPQTYPASRRPITRVSRAPLSESMPWRHTTTTSMGPSRRPAFPSTRPPLVPSGNRDCQAFGPTGRGTATPSAARSGLSLRERVRLYQQQKCRETNLNAYHEDLHNNYCMGNDVKRFRYDTIWPGSAPPSGLSKSEDCMSSATPTTGVGKENSAAIIRNRNLTRIEGTVPSQDEERPKIDKLSPEALHVYGEQAQGLRKLTETYDQADGINVSFCLRDLANAFLLMPCGSPREYDITKAPWIDDGVSYFVSTPPTRFRGGWESYLQHLNLYQQPFYLRDKAFIFVLRVPYHSHLRVCVAVHNLNDLMDILRQRPLAQILPTKEQVWTQERMFAEESTNQQNLTETVEEVRFFGLIRRRRVTRGVDGSIKHKVDTEARKRRASHQQAYEQHQASGLRVTWRQRFTLLCLQASATLRGVVWRQCTTPLLTDPTVLQARMSYLSNRTAAYAALRQRLNTLKALSTSLSRQRVEETPWKQIRMIQDRIDSVGTMELGRDTEQTMPSTRNDFPPPSAASTPPPGSLAAAFSARRAAARRVTATAGTTTSTATGGGLAPSSGFSKAPTAASSGVRRTPFRVNRIGDGYGTSARTLRQPPHESQGFGATAPPPTTTPTTTDSARVPPLRSTIAPYASSATLSRPPSPPPIGTAKATATMRMNGKVVGEEHDGQEIAVKDDTSGSDVLLRIAERLSARGDFEKEILTPPLTTVLKFTSSHAKEEKDHEQHSTQQKQSVCGTGSVLAGLLPAPMEIHRQHASFDITVTQMQQLLQWQWEHHQNSYEVVPLPVFRGALVTPTSTYFSGSYVELDGTRDPRQLGVSPLSRSLLLGLIKWGWLVPLDYEASRWDAQLRFTSDWASLFIAQWSAISKWKLWVVLFLAVAWREQALGAALLYAVFRCFIIVARSVFGVVAIRDRRVNRLSTAERRLPALDSGTSIVYRQSEAAVSAMLEDRQYFRSQLLATRILQAQHGVMNVWSRASLLISGHSPMLLFIIGCEFILIGLLYLCYAFVATHTQFLTISLKSLWHLETFFALLPGYDSDGLLQRWSTRLMLPSGLEDAKTLGFFLVLYVLCISSSRSPLRYMFRVTWDLFLHDDALVRRPALSF